MLNMTHKLVSVKRDHLCGLRVCFKTTTVFIFFLFRKVMQCMEYLYFLLSKSQFGCCNESLWSHTLPLRGHEAISNCFMVFCVVYTGLI